MNDNNLQSDWNNLIRRLPKKKSLFKCFQRGTRRSSEDEGVYTCECKDGWYGPTCNQERPKFSSIFRIPGSTSKYNIPLSDDYQNCEEEPGILKKLHLSLEKAKKCTYIAGPINPNGLVLGRFNIKWDDGEVMPINYLGMGERHTHDLKKIEKLGGSGRTILPSVFIEAAIASARADNKCVDLFVEHNRFQPSRYRTYIGWLNMYTNSNNMVGVLEGEVAPCLHGIRIPDHWGKEFAERRKCKFGCKNVRIHETDLRSKSYHLLLSKENVFGLRIGQGFQQEREQGYGYGRTLASTCLVVANECVSVENMLKFALYEDSMDETEFEVVLYRALARHLAAKVFQKKVLDNNMSFLEWLNTPMLHTDYLEDFRETNVTPDSITDFLEKKETPSYTNWDKISQVAHQFATDFIYHRNATKKLIRKRESALGERRSAQLKKAIIKVHNLRNKFLRRNRLSLLALGVMSMDYYTMLRMLSPYDTTKRAGPCPPKISGGNQPRYIMMVAGVNHILNYAYVFRELAELPVDVDNDGLANLPLEKPFRITNTVIFDKEKISKAGNSIKTGLDLIHEWMKGETPLIIAARQGDTERVRFLIERHRDLFSSDFDAYDYRGDFDAYDEEGNTALMYAVIGGHTEIAQLLIEAGADVNLRDEESDTALILAISKGYTEIARLLIREGADVNAQTTALLYGDRTTALMYAVGNGGLMQDLIEAGANLNVMDDEGNTALTLAVREGHLASARLLIWWGADLDVMNDEGDTALTLAVREGHRDIARLLIREGANTDVLRQFIRAGANTDVLRQLRQARRRRENDDSQRRTRRRFR